MLERCSLCGLCKSECPIFRIIKRETVSPRGKLILMKSGVLDKIFHICNLCGACDEKCPVNVKIKDEIRKRREDMIAEGMETAANKEMIDNIREFGNPYGKVEKDKKPDRLYGC